VALADDRWSINVLQKVPLNSERDNVPPAYLKELRVAVLNQAFDLLTKDEATNDWVSSAVADERAQDHVVNHVLTARYGEKRVSYDPSDPEANKLAVSKGYTVISGGGLSGGLWRNAKRSDAIKPAGQVTPSPKPYSDDPNAPPVKIIPRENWSEDQRNFVGYAEFLHDNLIGNSVSVRIVHTTNNFSAAYGSSTLDLNVFRLGKKWFKPTNIEKQLALLLHEFAHYYCGDHLNHKFHDAICDLGAKLAIQLGASSEAPNP